MHIQTKPHAKENSARHQKPDAKFKMFRETSAKQHPTGQKRTANEAPTKWRMREETLASRRAKPYKRHRRGASQPQETQKEAGQQKPDLPQLPGSQKQIVNTKKMQP